ncbi:MAG: hypothetical protein CMO40_06955 [Verrucomicrobiaceae bacterium]|nr:hypothetical protein [Verrucomicrobiaceae bacterium]
MSKPELTRDLLMEAGGWKEMKSARDMHRSGLVQEAVYHDGWLEGVVMMGGKPKRVRMEILSATHMENKCSCVMARREGRVCAHAMAVGLEVLAPSRPARGAAPREEPEQESLWPLVQEPLDGDAYPITCRVMLPLKLSESWERGQLLVVIGTEYEGEEHLLSTWGPDYVLQVDEQDERLLDTLRRLFPTEPPGVVSLDRAQFLQLLDGLTGHRGVTIGKRQRASVASCLQRAAVRLNNHRLGVCWPEALESMVQKESAWGFEQATHTFYPVVVGLPGSLAAIWEGGLVLNPVEARACLAELGQWFEIGEDVLVGLPEVAGPQVEVCFEGSLNNLEARMTFLYGGRRREAGIEEAELIAMEEGNEVLVSPDLERCAEDALRQWGFEGPARNGRFILRDREAILRFHAHGVSRLDPEWIILKGERFQEFAKDILPLQPVYRKEAQGEDWFEISVHYQISDGTRLTQAEVQRVLQTGRSSHALAGNRRAVLDSNQVEEALETLADCDPDQQRPGVFRMDHRQAAFLRESVAGLSLLSDDEDLWAGPTGRGFDAGALKQVLRPYQLEGVRWLWKLADLRMGGILADDMGLGKTVQTLAFLSLRGGPALVVCPSSLVYNWIAEAERFVPGLKAVAIEGPARKEVLAAHQEADLLVTSYALLRIDRELYREREFNVIVLDEAQQIKNPDAQVTKAAVSLRGKHRFALTGTPIENSVRDLWSIMNFVMPGYLGERERFAARFEKPLARGDAPALQGRLARRLKPVVLRRLKEEVAGDLPEKIEQVRYCDLSALQREIYESILQESRNLISGAEGGRKRMVALTALLRLRQACCDLRLLDLPGVEENGSVKMDELEGLLHEAVAGGHRVLVFSQFVQMLQGIVPMLGELGYEFCYLDGQTKNRGEVVQRFQQSAVPVFLISLKAGGVGLNLTGADTVIHVDPWWNPAVEAQATDRAHRIGQERVVTSYKLITRDTVEEKILSLQERKRKLIPATLGEEPGSGAAFLSEDEIFSLFG